MYLFVYLNVYLSVYLIYFWEREIERKHKLGRGRGREREREREKQAPDSELSAQSPTQAQTHELWDHDLSWSQILNQVSNLGAPDESILKH